MRCVEIRRFARIHHRAATDRDIAVDVRLARESRRVLQREIGGLDRHFVENDGVDVRRGERSLHLCDVLAARQMVIGEQGNALQSKLDRVAPRLRQNAGAECKRRHAEREAAVASLDSGEIGVTAGHALLLEW